MRFALRDSFNKSLRQCVSTSDRIGYIYWFFVLITISCGGATGIFVTYKNRVAMERICTDKLDYYTANYGDQMLAIASPSSSSALPVMGAVGTSDEERVNVPSQSDKLLLVQLYEHVAVIEDQLK